MWPLQLKVGFPELINISNNPALTTQSVSFFCAEQVVFTRWDYPVLDRDHLIAVVGHCALPAAVFPALDAGMVHFFTDVDRARPVGQRAAAVLAAVPAVAQAPVDLVLARQAETNEELRRHGVSRGDVEQMTKEQKKAL